MLHSATCAVARSAQSAAGDFAAHAASRLPARLLLRASTALAFLAVALASFDAFPYKLVGGFHPRLTYLISLSGVICYLASLHWRRHWRRHRALLGVTAVFLLHGLVVAAANAFVREGQGLALFSLLNYLERQIAPAIYMLWFAFLLSSLPPDRSRRLFLAALMTMFLSNAAHMLLELLANSGATGIRDFLIALNPWFRLENAHWGNWPPPSYEGRVRGLFSEPAHMAYAFTPVLAFFFHKLHKQAVYALPLIFVCAAYCWSSYLTGTGVISLGFLSLAFAVVFCYEKWGARGVSLALCVPLAALLAFGGALLADGDRLADYAAQRRSLEIIADYCRQAQDDPSLPPPELETSRFSRFFFRALSTRLEWDIARQHPFGIGYQLSGAYRKPLAAWEREDLAQLFRVRYALDRQRDPVPVFPYFCEYTALAAELGLVQPALFLLLCLHVGRRAWRRYRETGDVFIRDMLFALPAFLLMLLSFALRSGLMMYYFLGFLYALGMEGRGAARPAGGE
jgi:hypothetical protein